MGKHHLVRIIPGKLFYILKVQKQFDEGMNEMIGSTSFLTTALTVYSQHHNIYGYLSPKSPFYKRLKKSCELEGRTLNYKVYIQSYQREGRLMVNTQRIIYPRSW